MPDDKIIDMSDTRPRGERIGTADDAKDSVSFLRILDKIAELVLPSSHHLNAEVLERQTEEEITKLLGACRDN